MPFSLRLFALILALALATASCAPIPAGTPTGEPTAAAADARPILSAGAAHTCLIDTAGKVSCWGDNQFGQLGGGEGPYRALENGPLIIGASSWVLAEVALEQPAAALAAGAYHTCAALVDGSARCWGRNDHQQLGNSQVENSRAPMPVPGLGGKVTALAAGFDHTCALLEDGAVMCWGSNAVGQLGAGPVREAGAPVRVEGLPHPARQIGSGGSFSCALLETDELACWGSADSEDSGGAQGGLAHPATVVDVGAAVEQLATGLYHLCALITGGEVHCWAGMGSADDYAPGNTMIIRELAGDIQMLSAGAGHTCALTGAGGVKCWGENFFGQLGDGSDMTNLEPVDAAGLTAGAVHLAAGHGHTCAALENGGIRCWGDASAGQLGDGAISWRGQ
jgi:alpha-tubulin suppressor-like RCC1 family protein